MKGERELGGRGPEPFLVWGGKGLYENTCVTAWEWVSWRILLSVGSQGLGRCLSEVLMNELNLEAGLAVSLTDSHSSLNKCLLSEYRRKFVR